MSGYEFRLTIMNAKSGKDEYMVRSEESTEAQMTGAQLLDHVRTAGKRIVTQGGPTEFTVGAVSFRIRSSPTDALFQHDLDDGRWSSFMQLDALLDDLQIAGAARGVPAELAASGPTRIRIRPSPDDRQATMGVKEMNAYVVTSSGMFTVPDVDDVNVAGDIALVLKTIDGEQVSRCVVRLREGDYVVIGTEPPARNKKS
jgi:hypothetical protein